MENQCEKRVSEKWRMCGVTLIVQRREDREGGR